MSCIFCQLIQGDLPGHRAYEDTLVAAILVRRPLNPGHSLVVTKAHIENFYDVEDEVYIHLMLVVKQMARPIRAVFHPLQVVMETSGIGNRHVHVHVLPVYGLYDRVPKEVLEQREMLPSVADDELARIAQSLKHGMSSMRAL